MNEETANYYGNELGMALRVPYVVRLTAHERWMIVGSFPAGDKPFMTPSEVTCFIEGWCFAKSQQRI